MLGNLTVFYSPQIIVGGRSAAEGTFGNGKHIVALCQNLMNCIIDHLNALLCQCAKRCAKTGKTICNAGVVLNIGITIEVGRGLFRSLTLHHIMQEVLDDFAVLFSLIKILQLVAAVDLGVAGGVRLFFLNAAVLSFQS